MKRKNYLLLFQEFLVFGLAKRLIALQLQLADYISDLYFKKRLEIK